MPTYSVRRTSFLAHHGVKGQKWGVRRYQDYDGHLIGAKKQSKTKTPSSANSVSTEKWDHLSKDETITDSRMRAVLNIGLGALSLNPVLMGMGVAQLGGAAYAAKKTSDVNKRLESNQNVDPKTGFKLKQSQMSPKEDLKMVNPGFHNLQDNTKSNCMLCTTTYDLRRRGYDVTAGKAAIGYTSADLKRWYPKAETKTITYENTKTEMFTRKNFIEATTKALVSQGDGARGNLMVRWTPGNGGGGHSMVYEVSGGKLRILDGQSNKIYDEGSINPPKNIIRQAASATYTRLDNVEPDWEEVKECVRS